MFYHQIPNVLKHFKTIANKYKIFMEMEKYSLIWPIYIGSIYRFILMQCKIIKIHQIQVDVCLCVADKIGPFDLI